MIIIKANNDTDIFYLFRSHDGKVTSEGVMISGAEYEVSSGLPILKTAEAGLNVTIKENDGKDVFYIFRNHDETTFSSGVVLNGFEESINPEMEILETFETEPERDTRLTELNG